MTASFRSSWCGRLLLSKGRDIIGRGGRGAACAAAAFRRGSSASLPASCDAGAAGARGTLLVCPRLLLPPPPQRRRLQLPACRHTRCYHRGRPGRSRNRKRRRSGAGDASGTAKGIEASNDAASSREPSGVARKAAAASSTARSSTNAAKRSPSSPSPGSPRGNSSSDAASGGAVSAAFRRLLAGGASELLIPVRYRCSSSSSSAPGAAAAAAKGPVPYSREHAAAAAWRLPLFVAVAAFLSWEETSPFVLVSVRGPSMLPTIAADGSDVWLRRTHAWSRIAFGLFGVSRFSAGCCYVVGDLAGFAHPRHPDHVSCKRIVGVAGDRVRRYGQYAHLYADQDPENNFGIRWPNRVGSSSPYAWMDENWDAALPYREEGGGDDGGREQGELRRQQRHQRKDPDRTIVVPDGHVWLEGDCPALAVDSRQYGPVPVEWLKGKLVARLWPLRKAAAATDGGQYEDSYKRRPHPIPLDEDTLRAHNVHYKM